MHTLPKCTFFQNFHYGPKRVHLERVDCSFKPAKQLSLNNQRRFTLVKAVKLRSEVEKRKNEEFRELVMLIKMQISPQASNIYR